MNRLIDYFHQKYYPDLDIEEVANAMAYPSIQESALTYVQQRHYPDMSIDDVASQVYSPQEMIVEDMGGEGEKGRGGEDAAKEADAFLEDRKHKKGKLTMAEAMDYIDKKGLEGDDAFKFLEDWSPSTISTIFSNQGLIRTMKNPDFKAPITKEEIDSYDLYSQEIEKRKGDTSADELEAYLVKNKYAAKKPLSVTGKKIIEDAKSKSNKVKMEQNPDGSYTIYDDESTFKDTEAPFGKGLRIYPDAKYSKTLYGKGKDLRNVYKPTEYAPHKGRIPTDIEKASYAEGNYATGALTPEYKYYYANAYLKPNADKTMLSSKEKPFYAADSSEEDVDRLVKVNRMKEQMNKSYQSYSAKQKKKADREDFMKKLKWGIASGSKGTTVNKLGNDPGKSF